MSQQLDQLKNLLLEGEYDQESRRYVAELEVQLTEAIATEKLALHPTIIKFTAFLKDLNSSADTLLKTNRELTDLERHKLFERKDVCDYFLNLFEGNSRESVERSITEALDNAKTS